MMNLSRLVRHLFATTAKTRKCFPAPSLKRIEEAIAQSEIGHSGQIQVVIETSLSPQALFHQQTPRERSMELFSIRKIWDTENNNGVLIYLLMADHAFEIVADRGIHKNVGDEFWHKVCNLMESHLKNKDFEEGILIGIQEIDKILKHYYPSQIITPNELSDQPVLI